MPEFHDGRLIERHYDEQMESYDPEEVDSQEFLNADIVEVDYLNSRSNVKTLRGSEPQRPGTAHKEDLDALVFGISTRYGINLEMQEVYTNVGSYDDELEIIAADEDLVEIRLGYYPGPVPVVGCPQEKVEATVFYESKRSGNIKQMTVDVKTLEGTWEYAYGNDDPKMRIYGEHKYRGRVEIDNAWERRVQSQTKGTDLGRCVRVEFPKGHRFSVDLKNVPDDKLKEVQEMLQQQCQKVTDKYSLNVDTENSVEISHEGRIDD